MSPWQNILSAPSTSEAIERAALIPLPLLSTTSLPLPLESLSDRAARNLRAVRRALGVKVPGLPLTGWELWHEHEEISPCEPSTEINLSHNAHVADVFHTTHLGGLNVSHDGDAPAAVPTDIIIDTPGEPTKQVEGPVDTANVPPAPEVKCAEQLKHWALSSPHKQPPVDLIDKLCHSSYASALLEIVSPGNHRTDSLAGIITAFTGRVGSSFATSVMQHLIIPYTKQLTTPAPRDIMQAVIAFSEQHWRAVPALYQYFAALQPPVNGAIAELLVRVTAVITAEGAYLGLQHFCNSPKWGEDGIRVAESLLSKCKDQKGVAETLVPALDRNATFCEKSVRFGKLLFTAVKDLPEIVTNHKEAMELICSRSKVFLGKRALALLKSNRPNV